MCLCKPCMQRAERDHWRLTCLNMWKERIFSLFLYEAGRDAQDAQDGGSLIMATREAVCESVTPLAFAVSLQTSLLDRWKSGSRILERQTSVSSFSPYIQTGHGEFQVLYYLF